MTALLRRGACPSLAEPMQTGDGLLVRLNPVAECLTPTQLSGLGVAANRAGNGIIEITARGSLQFRGVKPETVGALAQQVADLGIVPRTGVPVEVGPLAGLDPVEIADARPLAEAMREGMAQRGLSDQLGPKVSVVVDGGGAINLGDIASDVRLTAARRRNGAFWRIALAGDSYTAEPMGGSTARGAVGFALDLLEQIAALGLQGRGRDLIEGGFATLPSGKPRGSSAERSTLIPLKDNALALAIALPFGSVPATWIIALADAALRLGIVEFRLSPGRQLLAICPDTSTAADLADEAQSLGLITNPHDPRRMIAACPGAPACASGEFSTRSVAQAIADQAPALFDGTVTLHVSGCAKGCAHPAAAALTLVGASNRVGLVVNGTARARPLAYLHAAEAQRVLADIAQFGSRERRSGETMASVLTRIGPDRLAGICK